MRLPYHCQSRDTSVSRWTSEYIKERLVCLAAFHVTQGLVDSHVDPACHVKSEYQSQEVNLDIPLNIWCLTFKQASAKHTPLHCLEMVRDISL